MRQLVGEEAAGAVARPKEQAVAGEQQIRGGWRLKAGITLFVLSIGWPLLIPILSLLGVTGTTIAAFSGIMVVVAEFMLLAGAAIAGKEGFARIKSLVFGFLKAHGPVQQVSPTRYTIGLVLFTVPLLIGWATPYFGHYVLGLVEHPLAYAIAGDVMLVASLFVLGGDFWDKLRSLFLHRATAVIPEDGSILDPPQSDRPE